MVSITAHIKELKFSFSYFTISLFTNECMYTTEHTYTPITAKIMKRNKKLCVCNNNNIFEIYVVYFVLMGPVNLLGVIYFSENLYN
jgi:hypothetical protein